MDKSEPSADELVESVIRAGAEAGYRVDRDEAGRLRITAVREVPVDPALVFRVTNGELRDYYTRLSAESGGPLGAGTPWEAWMLLMSTHLDEAVYEAGRLDGPGAIVIGDTGFRAVSRSTTD
ncbi:hypothetical protein C8258_13670 [Nocardia sp. MDA0666]|uniref:hypothetical protein n=1 Tax=Nocardia sp. MDA0666 TaxID=2135448 RepID=UPI000D12BE32|nr:hypothetical protein [Nocardia sp. MDA0666]PSR67525.1 hypothetical protein C8258_13670 [Nocardia sp. MDA0666]